MTLDKLIRKALWNKSDQWEWHTFDRFLQLGDVQLVRPISGRWSYVVPRLGNVPLLFVTHCGIEWARRLKKAKKMPDLDKLHTMIFLKFSALWIAGWLVFCVYQNLSLKTTFWTVVAMYCAPFGGGWIAFFMAIIEGGRK